MPAGALRNTPDTSGRPLRTTRGDGQATGFHFMEADEENRSQTAHGREHGSIQMPGL
jgi:hypothetical protein